MDKKVKEFIRLNAVIQQAQSQTAALTIDILNEEVQELQNENTLLKKTISDLEKSLNEKNGDGKGN